MEKKLNPDITQLDDLLSVVAQGPEDESARRVQEHLREACQHGAVGLFNEYLQELESARRATGGMTNQPLRSTVARVIGELIQVAQTP